MAYQKSNLFKMEKDFVYRGRKTSEISFPLGGIGTGCIGLAGNGRLVDWEIFNRPNKDGSVNGFSFFAIKAKEKEKLVLARVLNGDLNPPYIGKGCSYGIGVANGCMSGLPHFEKSEFKGEFPMAQIRLIDDEVPLDVRLKAFNPFIPLNDNDSSIPAAIFIFEVKNTHDKELDISLVANLSNPFNKGATNKYFDKGSFKGIKLCSNFYLENDPEYGDITVSTNEKDISRQSYWYRGTFFDNLTLFWRDFISSGRFRERIYNQPTDTSRFKDVASLCTHKTLKPGETREFKFIITWSFPNFVNYWNPGECQSGKKPQWRNYYATIFKDSTESAKYVWKSFEHLYRETLRFKDTLFRTTVPDYVLDAISSNLSILKSPTCIRLTDGTLYGFEGCNLRSGCCEGSCTHVWNYAQALPFLFPSLERGMREIDYQYNQFENGKMAFRMMLPPDRAKSSFRAAADGQMGGVIKTYREWKISGDTQWLRRLWPKVKKALEYAWQPTNEDWWDKDCDGVMEGIQHHTLDVEIYGPNSYITGYYLTALLAASKMAEALADEDARKYYELYEKGRKWVNENLYNGEYFHQEINLKDERFPIDRELKEIKHQIGEGCHIDQVIGQWHAHIVGLGYIFNPDKVRKALKSIFKYNFIETFREYFNPCRIYALNDEKGIVICTWPKGNSPKVPVTCFSECMNGFEYQVACHMIYEGLIDEGLSIVKAVRDRYDGEKRNPWNEFECGSNYARSMASYSLLLALSGFEYDMTKGHIGFGPKINRQNFYCFWSIGTGWGSFEIHESRVRFSVKSGDIFLNSFACNVFKTKQVEAISLRGKKVSFAVEDGCLRFESQISIKGDEELCAIIK